MSLQQDIPKLDDRSFDDLVNELRLRIPRYAPEWTDFNDSDPGMTLVQLFAWLTETLQYRLNQVPERSYLKFLQLLGLELTPAQPALAHLTFVAKKNAPQVRSVPRHTRIQGQASDGGDPLIFETERELDLIRFLMSDIQVFDGAAYTVLTQANQARGTSYRPLGWVPQQGSALYLGFNPGTLEIADRLFPREMRFRVFLPTATGAQSARSCTESNAPPAPPVTLVWEYWPSEDSPHWQRLNLFEDDTAAFTREGYLSVAGPKTLKPTRVGKVSEARYWLRCRLVTGSYPAGRYPEIDLIRPNTVPARHLLTVREERVGTSEGHLQQKFQLARRPVLRDSLSLSVEEPDHTQRTWVRRDDFLGSQSTDSHYTLNHNTGEIRFGDGRHGLIPPAGAEIIASEYRYGGGKAGNLAADLINQPMAHLPGVDKILNERRAEGGRDEEPVAELKQRAPAALRSRGSALSAADFKARAEEAGGVLKATALPLAHPSHPGVEVPGALTVVIVPDTQDIPPRPSADLIRATCDYLDGYRPITAELFVREPLYLHVRLEMRVVAERYAALDAVAKRVEQALNLSEYLDPRRQEFGRDIYPSRFYDVILDVEGVRSVESLTVFVDRQEQPLQRKIEVPADGLLYATGHQITVVPAGE